MEKIDHSNASSTLISTLNSRDRILILGSSGWLGKTLAAMMIGSDVPVMNVASRPRSVTVNDSIIEVVEYNLGAIQRFRPTFVVDFASLTKEKIGQVGLDEFRNVNEKLSNQLLQSANLPSVEKVLFTSSGAAVYPSQNTPKEFGEDPYGYLKLQLELKMQLFASDTMKPVQCLRPWSVSGPMVSRPMEYAFSSIVVQALSGNIRIESSRQVFRRYCAVDDLLAVAFATMPDPGAISYGLLESGGELRDLISLAERVVELVGNGATIVHAVDPKAKPDTYYSDNSSW
jgi:nucleoside-diphosphate-sugar epimerase